MGADSGFRSIAIDLPDEPARLGFARLVAERAQSQPSVFGRLADRFSDVAFAQATSGLRLADIEELFRRAGASSQPIAPTQVREKKQRTIRQLAAGLLEVVEPSSGFGEVAGCEHAKRYFRAVRLAWRGGLRNLPQAVLLAGVPGSGKSFLVRAVAAELDCPLLVMRGVREMWVGQSERNLDRVLQVIDNLAPCILWTDEIDQVVGGERSGGPTGDSGTNARLLGRLLEYFGDSRIRGRVLWIATTNRPDLLDVAIKDRFSVKIPFLHSLEERAALLPILAHQIGRTFAPDLNPSLLAEAEEAGDGRRGPISCIEGLGIAAIAGPVGTPFALSPSLFDGRRGHLVSARAASRRSAPQLEQGCLPLCRASVCAGGDTRGMNSRRRLASERSPTSAIGSVVR